MKSRNSIIFLLAAVAVFVFPKMIQAETSDKVRLELKVLSSDHIIFTPAELEFRLTNLTDKTINNIREIDYREPLRGIKIFVIFKRVKKEIIKPVLSDIDESNTPRRPDFDLLPGELAVFRHSLVQDWAFNNPLIFSTPGIYTVYGTHPVPGYGIIESNRVEIEYRGPITKNEIEAVNLMKPFGNYLQYIYDPGHLSSVKEKNVIHRLAATVRKIYEFKPETIYKKHLKNALKYWQLAEKKAEKEHGPHRLKQKEFDKLGLQDLDLGEK